MQTWSQQKKPYSYKKLRNQSIRGQVTFGIQLQTFPLKCNMRKLQSKTWKTDEKTHSNNRGNYTRHYNEKRSCSHFPSFMSQQYLSIRSNTCLHLKKFKFYLIFTSQKNNSGTPRGTNEQVHQQVPLTSFKTQFLQFTKQNTKTQLTQNFQKGQIGFQK